jgi:mono/diheme cytochrome c family protein
MKLYRWMFVIGVSLLALAGVIAAPVQGDGLRLQDSTPVAGVWTGTAYFGPEGAQSEAALTFMVDDAGQVTGGAITLVFAYEGMSDELLDLMQTNGCLVGFAAVAPDSAPVAGQFTSSTTATGAFSAMSCALEGFGDMAFAAAVSGTWEAQASASAVEPISAATARPTRRPTLDPDAPPTPTQTLMPAESPTPMPTRQPTLDPNEPTPRPTRRPTLDPNEPTPAPTQPGQEPAAAESDAPAADELAQEVADAGSADEPLLTTATGIGTDFAYYAGITDEEGFAQRQPHPNDDLDGRGLYLLHCSECHGQRGEGTAEGETLAIILSPLAVANIVREGPETMDQQTHEDVTDAQLNLIIDYVLRFERENQPRPGFLRTLGE